MRGWPMALSLLLLIIKRLNIDAIDDVSSIPCHPPSTQLPPILLLGLEVHTPKRDLEKSPTWVQEVESGNFRCGDMVSKKGTGSKWAHPHGPLDFSWWDKGEYWKRARLDFLKHSTLLAWVNRRLQWLVLITQCSYKLKEILFMFYFTPFNRKHYIRSQKKVF